MFPVGRAGRDVAVNTKAPGDGLRGAQTGPRAREEHRCGAAIPGEPSLEGARGLMALAGLLARDSSSKAAFPRPTWRSGGKLSRRPLQRRGRPGVTPGSLLATAPGEGNRGPAPYVVEQLRSCCDPLPGRTRVGGQGIGNFRHFGRGVKRQFVRLGRDGRLGTVEAGLGGGFSHHSRPPTPAARFPPPARHIAIFFPSSFFFCSRRCSSVLRRGMPFLSHSGAGCPLRYVSQYSMRRCE